MLQRKVNKMVMKNKMRKVVMCGQELLHFPDRARPSWAEDALAHTQLQPE